jgi:hypothetical protein
MMGNRRPRRAPEERRSLLSALELLSLVLPSQFSLSGSNSPASGPAAAPLGSSLFGLFSETKQSLEPVQHDDYLYSCSGPLYLLDA